MKIEIDLNDILGDEYGTETIQESVKRQVVEKLKSGIEQRVIKEIELEVSRKIDQEISKVLESKIPGLFDNLLEEEFTPVGRYGDREKPTTIRKRFTEKLIEECKYEKNGNSGYTDNRNYFSKAVDSLVQSKVDDFKKEFNSLVDSKFKEDSLKYAVTKLKEAVGLK